MKKRSVLFMAMILMLAMALFLTGCGKKGAGNTSTSGPAGKGGNTASSDNQGAVNEIASNELLEKMEEQATFNGYTKADIGNANIENFQIGKADGGRAEFAIFGQTFELQGEECGTSDNAIVMFDNGVADAVLFFGEFEKSYNEYAGALDAMEEDLTGKEAEETDLQTKEKRAYYKMEVRDYADCKTLLASYFKTKNDFSDLGGDLIKTEEYEVSWLINTADNKRADSIAVLNIKICPTKYQDDKPMQYGVASILIKGTDNIKSDNLLNVCNGVKALTGVDLMDEIYCCYDASMQLLSQKYATLPEGEYSYKENVHQDENFTIGFRKSLSAEDEYVFRFGKSQVLAEIMEPNVSGELDFKDYGNGTQHFYTDGIMDNQVRIYVDERDQKLTALMTDTAFNVTDLYNQLGEPAYIKCYLDDAGNKKYSVRWVYGDYFITAGYKLGKDYIHEDGSVDLYQIKDRWQIEEGVQVRHKALYTDEYKVPVKDQELDDWIHEVMY